MSLTWLHVSDFHIRADESPDRQALLGTLAHSVRWYRTKKRYVPDLMFVTGDVAFSGKPAEYEAATRWLDELVNAAGLTRRELFVIPGNHDVDRARALGLVRTYGTIADADAYLRPDVPPPHLTAKLAGYMSWYDSYFQGVRAHPESTCGPVEAIEVGGRRVGVLPINSAIFCFDDHDHAKLWIGRVLLEIAAKQLEALQCDLRVATVHHPLDWLATDEIGFVRRVLSESVDVVLRGHLHETDVHHVASHAGSNLMLAAGAAYNTSRWPNRALYVTVDGSEARVYPIHYVDRPHRAWTLDTSVFPRSADHTEVFPLGVMYGDATPPPSAETPGPRLAIRVDATVPLIGRAPDRQWLDGLWAAALNGVRTIGLVRGAKGLGKTRLAVDWMGSATPPCRVLYGDAAVGGPYEPFASALAEHLRGLPIGAVKWVVGANGGQLARIVPDLPDAVRSSLPPEGERGPGRHRLFLAVRTVLDRLSMACPTVLIVDNAHLLDEDGLTLLQTLLTLDQASLLVLLLTRPYGGTPFERALPQLRRDHVIHDWELSPLTTGESQELIRARTGSELPRGLLRKACGVPVRLETFARRPDNVVAGDPERAIVEALPEDVRLLIDLVAICPDDMPTEVLAQAAGIGSDAALSKLRHGEGVGLIAAGEKSGSDGLPTWHFTHAVRRQAAFEALPEPRRTELARRLAEVFAPRDDRDPAVLANWFSMARNPAEAEREFLAAGEAAEQSLAYDAAATFYEQALAHAVAGQQPAMSWAMVHNRIGYCLWHAGKFRDARAAYGDAASAAVQDDEPVELAHAALGRAGRIGFEGPSGGAEVAATCKLALNQLGDDHPSLRARVLAAMSHAVKFAENGSPEETQEIIDEAQRLARSLDDTRLLVEVLCTTSWAMWVPENLDDRKVLAGEAVDLADQLPDEVLRMEARLFRMTCELESGDVPSARLDADAISKLAASERSPYYLALSAMARAMLALLDGSEAGEPIIFEALGIAQREHNPALVRVFAAQMFYMRMLQCRVEELRTAAESLAEYDTPIVAWRSGLALLYAETGREVDAQRELDDMSRPGFTGVPRDTFWLVSMDNYARVATTLRDRAAAEQLVEQLSPYADQFVVAAGAGAVHGPVSLNLGVLHGMLGDYDTSMRLLQRAAEFAHAAGCLPAAAEAVVESAALMVSQADRSTVGEMVSQLRLAVQETHRVQSRKLALRLADSIDLCYTLAEGAEDVLARTTLDEFSHRLADLLAVESTPHGLQGMRRRLAPASLAGIRALSGGWTDDEIERRLSNRRSQRGVLAAMERFYRADVAHPFTGTVVLHLTMSDPDAEPIIWSLELRRDRAERLASEPDAPDLLVRMRATEFIGLLTGKVNGVKEWFEGRFDVQGDPIVASRLVEVFGGPAPVHAMTGKA